MSIIYPTFENNLGQMYTIEFQIKDTIENNASASYMNLIMSNGREVNLS